MRSATLFSATLLACLPAPPHAIAQSLSFGVVGGAGLTDSVQTTETPGAFPIRTFANAKDFVAGAMVELRFRSHWSVEVDGMFRELHITWAAVEPDGSLNSVSPAPVVTWEFPVLAKYRFQWRRFRPFVEAGPSFRTAGNLNGMKPSRFGVTAGAGIEMGLGSHWTVAPALRYTHWAPDRASYNGETNPNQLELLVGFSGSSESRWHPLGTRVAVGAIAGWNLTRELPTGSYPTQFGVMQPGGEWELQDAVETFKGLKGLIAGPTLEVELPRRLSVELDVLHHPLRTSFQVSIVGAAPSRPYVYTSAVTWEIPVPVKYRFPVRGAMPFVEAGPAFRLPQQVGAYLGTHGVLAGAGVEVRWRGLRIAPAIRYVHWGPDHPRGWSGIPRNQVQFLTGVTF